MSNQTQRRTLITYSKSPNNLCFYYVSWLIHSFWCLWCLWCFCQQLSMAHPEKTHHPVFVDDVYSNLAICMIVGCCIIETIINGIFCRKCSARFTFAVISYVMYQEINWISSNNGWEILNSQHMLFFLTLTI